MACKFGSVALLDRIWNTTVDLEPGGWGLWSVRNLLRTQKLYGKLEFSLCLLEAVRINRVDITQWLFERFPYGVRQKVICEAAKAGALKILHFFRANGTVVSSEDEEEDEDGEWDEETENWERGRYIHFGGLDAAQAALAGHADLVKWLYDTEAAEMRNGYLSINAAFSVGNMELALWIMNRVGLVDPEGHEAQHGAAANGHVETLQWLQDNGKYSDWDTGTMIKAVEAGQLKVVQWIIDRDRKDDTLGYESSHDEYYTGFGHQSRRTYITCLGGEASLCIHAAAINGHLEVAKYLHANIEKPHNQEEEEIEKHRLSQRIDELSRRFLNSAYVKPDEITKKVSGETMMLAAERGFLDVAKWLYTEYRADPAVNLFWVRGKVDENGYSEPFNRFDAVFCSVVDAAAGKGHLAIMQYLLEVGGKTGNEPPRKKRRPEAYPELSNCQKVPTIAACTTVAMDVAAAHGHLDVVQWLHANCSQGCTTRAMDLAAKNGHLETVKWLHGNRSEGCTTNAINEAAGNGHLDVVNWLHEHRSEGCTDSAMDDAAGGGHFEMLKWLHENRLEGCTDAAMDFAAAYGHFDIVKWLHKHRATCTTQAMDRAAQGGHMRVLRFLFENLKEGFTGSALRDAAEEFHFETVLVLHNIAQQGLAKEIRVMDAEQSDASISKFYLEIRHYVWARTPYEIQSSILSLSWTLVVGLNRLNRKMKHYMYSSKD